MKIQNVISFLAFGVIIAYAVYYIGSLGVRVGPPDAPVHVSMEVPDVNGLVVGSNVMLRGVPVGKVTGIESSVRAGTVHFYVDKRYPIPVDSEVRLENLSALGESYIGFVPRTAQGQTFRDGQKVVASNVFQPASISELATSVVHVLNQSDPNRLRRLVDEADRALPDDPTVLPNLARASSLLRGTVKAMNGRGSEVLANFQTLLQNAGFVGPLLASLGPMLLATGTPVYLALWVTRYSVVDAGGPEGFRQTKDLLDRVQRFLDTRAADLKVVAETLMPSVKGIAAALMNFDTGQILSNVLDALPEDGTITLRVAAPSP